MELFSRTSSAPMNALLSTTAPPHTPMPLPEKWSALLDCLGPCVRNRDSLSLHSTEPTEVVSCSTPASNNQLTYLPFTARPPLRRPKLRPPTTSTMQYDPSSSPELDKTFSILPPNTSATSTRRGSTLSLHAGASDASKVNHGAPGSSYSTKKHAEEVDRTSKFVLDKDWDASESPALPPSFFSLLFKSLSCGTCLYVCRTCEEESNG